MAGHRRGTGAGSAADPEQLRPQQGSDGVRLHVHGTERNGTPPEPGRYCEGPSLDGKGKFTMRPGFEPLGEVPNLGPARPDSAAQREQMGKAPTTNALR